MVQRKPVSQTISSPGFTGGWAGRYAALLFIFLACALLVFSKIQPQAVEKLHASAGAVAAPVLDFASRPFAHISSITVQISNLTALQSENERLRAENEKLLGWYKRALALNTEIESLRQIANLKLPDIQGAISTRIIADPGNAYVKSFLIALGTKDGIHAKQAVMAAEGLVGRVISTSDHSARILLLTDVGSRIPVYIEGAQQKAILSGQNNEFPLLTHMSKDISLDEGARVLTSGHGGFFPMGLPVGKVVKSTDGHYAVQTFADMNNIIHIKVLQHSIDPNLIRANLKN